MTPVAVSAAVSATVSAVDLRQLVAAVFQSLGVATPRAACVAESLVNADLEGIASHGVTLVPLYVERLHKGSVSATAEPRIEEDHGGLVVMSAEHTLGQVSAQVAVDLAIARARQHGVALVTVRHAFHFGAASFWARQFAQAGMVGFAFSNTRPLMPPPGGAERIVGNNPMAIAFPAATDEPLVVDMAMSATAMGKIRIAQAAGQAIPEGWATDAEGKPTTSPADAIEGMLLPAAGPKGFGLAVAIDLLCGALSGGAFGAAVRPLYGQLDQPYDCAHAFIAIDASRVGGGAAVSTQVAAFAETIRQSAKAPGTDRIYAPGDLERSRRAANGDRCSISSELAGQLNQLAQQAGVSARLALLST